MAAPDFLCRRMSGTCVERGGFWKEDNRPEKHSKFQGRT